MAILQFVGVKIIEEKKIKIKFLGLTFFGGFYLFFEIIFGDHFHISQFVPI